MSARRESLFGDVADALRAIAERNGYSLHVSTNTKSVTLTKQTRSRTGSEEDFSIKVRRVPVPVKPPRKTKAQLEKELAAERSRSADLKRRNASLTRSAREPDYSYFGLGDGPT